MVCLLLRCKVNDHETMHFPSVAPPKLPVSPVQNHGNAEIAAYMGPCCVHAGRAMPTVYPARTIQTDKVIGRRWSRWSTGAIGVRSHPRFRPDESRNATRTVPPRPPGPPRKYHFAAFSGRGGNTNFWHFWVPEKNRGWPRHRGVRPWT